MGAQEGKPRLIGQRRLNSWKEIAAYLERDERTARRWEKSEGLPVHRHQHLKLASVYAYTSEIDEWLRTRSADRRATEMPAAEQPSANDQYAQPETQRRKRFILWAALTSGILASFIWLLFQLRKEAPPLVPLPITSYLGDETSPALSPDGTEVAFSWNGEKQTNYDIYLQLIGSGRPLRLTTDPRLDTSPTFSPDGRWIAFIRAGESEGGDIIIIPALGGSERPLCHLSLRNISPGCLLDWSPDGNWIVVEDVNAPDTKSALFLVSVANGQTKRLTSPGADEADMQPAFSPDGMRIVFQHAIANSVSVLSVLSLNADMTAAGSPKRLTFSGFENVLNERPQWTPDGHSIIFSSTRGGLKRLWHASASGRGEPQLFGSLGERTDFPSVAHKANRLVYARLLDKESIWRVTMDGQKARPPERLISSTKSDDNPQFSPDGRRVAFESWRSGTMEIWVCDSDGSNALQITKSGGPVTGTPRWSPDGKFLAFDSRLTGEPQIYAVSAEGGLPHQITSPPNRGMMPSWSRDGKWIYFASNRSGRYEVWRASGQGGQETQVTTEGGVTAFESLDHESLYYTKGLSTIPSRLARVRIGGGEETIVLPSVEHRAFALTKSGIYYIPAPGSDGRRTLQLFDFARSGNTEVALIDGLIGNGLTISPDGKSILFSRLEEYGHDLMLVENLR